MAITGLFNCGFENNSKRRLNMSIINILTSAITFDHKGLLMHLRASMTVLIPTNYILVIRNSCCHIQDVKKHHEPAAMLFDRFHIYVYILTVYLYIYMYF